MLATEMPVLALRLRFVGALCPKLESLTAVLKEGVGGVILVTNTSNWAETTAVVSHMKTRGLFVSIIDKDCA